MFKNLLFTSFLLLNLIGIIYPTKKENTKLFDYCYSLEKILSRNSIKKTKNESQKVLSISKDILNFGISKTRGVLVNKMIDQYKASKNSQIIKIVPNRVYCYAGYWIENINPGTFESILYAKSKKAINEFRDYKDGFDEIINNINSEYKFIKKEFDSLF
tara:strand:+ start:719 stop:1195 length:477 start_codon:yes stop_codon:yes gene_type:complete